MLPAKVRDAGTLNIAISLAYPPMEYSDAGSTELKGADIDMAKEVACAARAEAELPECRFLPADRLGDHRTRGHHLDRVL